MSKVTKPVKKKKKPKNYYFDQVVENAIIRYNKKDDARLKIKFIMNIYHMHLTNLQRT